MPEVFRLPQISTDEGLGKKRLFGEKTESDWSQLVLIGERATSKRESFLNFFWVALRTI